MHSDLTLSGPVWWLLVFLMYACGGLALFVTLDPWRARRVPAFAVNPQSRWYWSLPQGLYFVLFLVGSMPGVRIPALAMTLVVATPFALGLQIAYLLRVVYPSPKRLAEREPE